MRIEKTDRPMQVERIGKEELLVRFLENPGTADTEEWLAHFRSFLTGTERTARVDLTALEILTSLGVNVVVGICQSIGKQGGTIRVDVASEKTMHVFELFQLTTLFEVRFLER